IPSPENASPATLVADSNTGLADKQDQVNPNAISIPKSNDEPDPSQTFFNNLDLELNVHAATAKTIFDVARKYSVPLGVTELSSYAIWKMLDPTYLGENRDEGLIDLSDHKINNF
ncbi:hypothetical protein MMC22_010022, partial [Lobaria immixta]|nr:hypothetical protein [Lobaria immixta]